MIREDLLRWVVAAALTLGCGLVGWLVRRLAAGQLARLFRETRTDLDDALLGAVSPHVPFWFLTLGVTLGMGYAHLDAGIVARLDRFALAAFLFSVTLALASFLTQVIASRTTHWPGALPATTLTQNALRITVIALGLLVVLGNLGIAVAPLLTALGVGSLAVALALQPTLSNLFAGFHITLARRIRIGDFVELETKQDPIHFRNAIKEVERLLADQHSETELRGYLGPVANRRLRAVLPNEEQRRTVAHPGPEDWTGFWVDLDLRGRRGADKGVAARVQGGKA